MLPTCHCLGLNLKSTIPSQSFDFFSQKESSGWNNKFPMQSYAFGAFLFDGYKLSLGYFSEWRTF